MVRSNTTKDIPNTYRRSTAETAMNPIGQTFPVIHIHLVGNSEHSVLVANPKTQIAFYEYKLYICACHVPFTIISIRVNGRVQIAL